MTYNSRSETIFEKPSYREPIKHKRCIIPSTGYFEYHHEGKETTPYYIYLKDEKIFSMGGIYDVWHDPETKEEVKTLSMITTPANEFTGWIHNGGKNPNRMPFIIPKELEETWLDPKLTKEDISKLFKPYQAKAMDAYTISKDFIKMNPHDPKIVKKVI